MAIKAGGDIATLTIPKILDPTSAESFDGVQYHLKDATARSLSLEYINGTQRPLDEENPTPPGVWLGNTAKTDAFNGMLIAYRLPYESATSFGGDPPTLTLTLAKRDPEDASEEVRTFTADVVLSKSDSEQGLLAAGTLMTLAYDAPITDPATTPVWRSAAIGVDSSFNSESLLPVQNRVITLRLNDDELSIDKNASDIFNISTEIHGSTLAPDGSTVVVGVYTYEPNPDLTSGTHTYYYFHNGMFNPTTTAVDEYDVVLTPDWNGTNVYYYLSDGSYVATTSPLPDTQQVVAYYEKVKDYYSLSEGGILNMIAVNTQEIERLRSDVNTLAENVPVWIDEALTTFENEKIWVWKEFDSNGNEVIRKGFKNNNNERIGEHQYLDSWNLLFDNINILKADDAGVTMPDAEITQTFKFGRYTLKIDPDNGSWVIS